MHQVFEKNELAGIKLNNRIIRSATGEAMADDKGRPSSKLAELYLQLAKGGLGAIVTGCISVHPKGIISKTAPMLHTDESIDDFKALVEPVKAYGTPLIAQLIHAGARINPAATGTEPVGPSPKRYPKFGSEARELTDNEIQEIQNIIMEDKADYVSMSRPLIREPDLVNKFYTGKQEKAKCIDCGLCLFGLFDNVPLRCYQNKT